MTAMKKTKAGWWTKAIRPNMIQGNSKEKEIVQMKGQNEKLHKNDVNDNFNKTHQRFKSEIILGNNTNNANNTKTNNTKTNNINNPNKRNLSVKIKENYNILLKSQSKLKKLDNTIETNNKDEAIETIETISNNKSNFKNNYNNNTSGNNNTNSFASTRVSLIRQAKLNQRPKSEIFVTENLQINSFNKNKFNREQSKEGNDTKEINKNTNANDSNRNKENKEFKPKK